jgi:hypothetical protein
MPTGDNQNSNQEIINALARNRELLEQIFASAEKTRQYIFWIKIVTIVKIVLIVLPLIIGLLFILPMLKNAINFYSSGAL